MEEKIITGHKNGMLVLLLELVLYIAAVVFLIVGINAGFLPLVVLCVILLLLGWIPLCGLRVLKPQEALVTLREGKFHQVKRMLAACGKPVTYLKRLSMGPLRLDEALAPGAFRPLSDREIHTLLDICGLNAST